MGEKSAVPQRVGRLWSRAVVAAVLLSAGCSDQLGPPPVPSADVASVTQPVILVGAGDISSCTSNGDSRTALLVKTILDANPTAWAFIAGDNVYEDGSTAEYRDCYGPTWGQFKARTRPSLGNHEYDGTEGSKPSFDYFGDALWNGSRPGGYYSFNLGDTWHIVVLNSNDRFVETEVGSPQDNWLKADLAANSRPCIAAIFHHPLFWSSNDTSSSGVRSYIKPFWQRLYAAGADLILNGHSHNYERFAPQNPDGVLDTQKGIRQFIVGMGGKSVSPATKNIRPNSEKRNGDTFGVMELTLNQSSYTWRFVPEAGKTFNDTGTNNCHGTASPPPPNTAPTADFTPNCSGLDCAFTDNSRDSDGTIRSWSWTFGDGATETVQHPSHRYAADGSYTVGLTVEDDDGATQSISKTITLTAGTVTAGVVLAGAGDIAHCSLSSDEATAKLLDGLPAATVFTLGNNANSAGSATDYTTCYGPTWGRHKGRTRPIPGYMDYKTTGASGYFGYFGSVAGTSGQGYYSYNLGDWHVIALNSMVSMSAGSAQERWLRADLAANPKVCTLAYIARARFSSGKNGNATNVQPLWQALYEKGADIILSGSDRDYERFARQAPSGAADPTKGIQQFVVGTGGQSLTGLLTRQPNSVVFNGSTFGVLKLTLSARGYTWQFVPVAGSTFPDAGTSDCVGAPPPVPNTPPTADFTATCTNLTCDFTDLSSDGDGTVATRSWDYGDGSPAGTTPSHTYATAKEPDGYTVTLTVTDNGGATNSKSVIVHPTEPGPPPANVPPTATFTPSCTNLDCDFKDTSEDTDGTLKTWSWTFGDGGTSDQPAPTHSYAAADIYTVTLKVTDDDDAESALFTDQVTVTAPLPNQPPTAAFTSPSCTAGVACSFDDTSEDTDGTVAKRKWDFGDGTPVGETTQDPVSHTYATADDYQVTLTVIDDDDAESAPVVQAVTVAEPPANLPPEASFTPPACTVDVPCSFNDQSTDSDGGSIAGRTWDFGDGTPVTSTTENPVSHTYTSVATYPVTLTAKDDDDGVSEPVTHDVIVSDAPPPPANNPPAASFTRSCNNLACTFTDKSTDTDGTIQTWSWNFGDGGTSTIQNPPLHTYAAGGSYTVTLTVKDEDQAETSTQLTFTVAANVAPTAAFTAPACTAGAACTFTHSSTDSDGTIVSRSWAFGDGTSSTSNSPSHVYAAAGTYTVRLTVKDDDGATGTTTRSVTVSAPPNVPPSAYFGSACTKLSCAFTDRSKDSDGTIVKWNWTFADGTFSTTRSPTHVYKAGGTYKVRLTVTDNNGATGTITHSVTVAP